LQSERLGETLLPKKLVRKLEPDPSRPRYLRTEPGIGYRFISDTETAQPPRHVPPRG
jgi:hypothetical protein